MHFPKKTCSCFTPENFFFLLSGQNVDNIFKDIVLDYINENHNWNVENKRCVIFALYGMLYFSHSRAQLQTRTDEEQPFRRLIPLYRMDKGGPNGRLVHPSPVNNKLLMCGPKWAISTVYKNWLKTKLSVMIV